MKTIKKLAVLVVVVMAIAAGGACAVEPNASKPGEIPEDLASLHCIGLRWLVKGDENRNAVVTVQYRKKGKAKWRAAMPLHHVETEAIIKNKPPEGTSVHAGSIFGLEPDTAYEVKLGLNDPDGGTTERVVTRTTWKEPIAPAPKRAVYVGPEGSGKKSLKSILSIVGPGDLVILKSGIYKGPFTFSRSGTEQAPIVFRAEKEGKAIIAADKGFGGCVVNVRRLRHVYLEGIGVKNGGWAIGVHGSRNMVIRRCHITGCHQGISDDANARRIWISDNLMVGVMPYPMTKEYKKNVKTEDRAIELSGRGHVICYNRIHHWKDGVDTRGPAQPGDVDIYRNDISECFDDGIELDYSDYNARAYENRITNCLMGISLQPSRGGPNYAVRNVLYNIAHESFKLHLTPVNKGPDPMAGPFRTSGGFLIHNTIVKKGPAMRVWSNEGPAHYFRVYNNLFVGTPARSAIELSSPTMRHAKFDHNIWAGQGITRFARWNRKNYGSIEQFSIDTGQEKHGFFISSPARLFVADFKIPKDEKTCVPNTDAVPLLAASSPAIDKGMRLPSINDDFTGRAPDLGAYELGQKVPRYGPREKE